MRAKIIASLLAFVFLSSLLAIPALAAGEVTKSQTVEFMNTDSPVPELIATTYYTDNVLSLPFTYRGVIQQPTNGNIIFPPNDRYSYVAHAWDYTGNDPITLGSYTEVVETYTLPAWNFVYSGASVSITYVQKFRGFEQTGDTKTVTLSINGQGVYAPTSTRVQSNGNIYQWTLTLDNLSSDNFKTLSFKTTYDYSMTKYDGIIWLSGLFPLTVSTSYDYATAYSQATFDLIQNGISPSVDHIAEQMDNTAAEMSRIAEQQAAIHSDVAALPSKNQVAMSQALEDHDASQYEWGKEQGKSQADDLIALVPTEKINQAGNAFGRLVDAMTTNKRTSYWEFPSMYIPAIDGVTERITLNQKIPFSLHEWFDNLPVSLVTLVRAVNTCALGLFFVKELMDLIAAIPKNGNGGTTDNG